MLILMLSFKDIFCLDFICTILFLIVRWSWASVTLEGQRCFRPQSYLYPYPGGAGLGSPWLPFLFLAIGPRIQCLCWQHQGKLLLLLTFMQNIQTSPVFQTLCVLASWGDCVNFSKRAFPQTSKNIHSLDCFWGHNMLSSKIVVPIHILHRLDTFLLLNLSSYLAVLLLEQIFCPKYENMRYE